MVIRTISTLGPLNAMHLPKIKSSADHCDLLAAPSLKNFPKLLSKVTIVHDKPANDPQDNDMVDLEGTNLNCISEGSVSHISMV